MTNAEVPTWRRLVVAVVVFLVVCFVGVAIAGAAGDLKDIDYQWSPGWLVLSVALLVLGLTMHCEIWRRILIGIGGSIGWRAAWRTWSFSLLARYVPTQVLMPVTRAALAQREGVPRATTITSFAYEFLLAVGAAATMALGYLLTLPALEGSPFRWLIVLAPVGLFACAHPRVVDVVAARLGKQLGFEPSHTPLSPARVVLVFAAYAASFFVLGLSIYALARGLRPVGGLTFDIATSFAIGYVASFLAFFLPAGLGAREGAMAAALTTAMPSGVAIAVVAGSRIALTGVELLFAVVTGLIARGHVGAATPAGDEA